MHSTSLQKATSTLQKYLDYFKYLSFVGRNTARLEVSATSRYTKSLMVRILFLILSELSDISLYIPQKPEHRPAVEGTTHVVTKLSLIVNKKEDYSF